MATKSIARGGPRKAASVPIRNITHEDLSIALRQGLDDFLTFRGDIVFAGLVYTVIGIAAVVMTASAPLMPFFFPVVAGVGLLGPVAAARPAKPTSTGSTSSMSSNALRSTTWVLLPASCC
jgi:uncharacterized membrane protein